MLRPGSKLLYFTFNPGRSSHRLQRILNFHPSHDRDTVGNVGGNKEEGEEGGSGTRHVKTYAIFRGKNREGFVLPARCWLEIGIFEGVPPLRTGLSCFASRMARHSSPPPLFSPPLLRYFHNRSRE